MARNVSLHVSDEQLSALGVNVAEEPAPSPWPLNGRVAARGRVRRDWRSPRYPDVREVDLPFRTLEKAAKYLLLPSGEAVSKRASRLGMRLLRLPMKNGQSLRRYYAVVSPLQLEVLLRDRLNEARLFEERHGITSDMEAHSG